MSAISIPLARSSRHDLYRLIATLLAAVAVMTLDILTPLGLAVWILQVVLVWLTSLWARWRPMLLVASVCSVSIVIGHYFSPADGTLPQVALSNVSLGLAAVWGITHIRLRQLATERARRKAADELAKSQATVRILSGMLPICSACKKIRNDHGGWEQMEMYIRNHSEAEFTHGICEECATRFYAEYAPEIGAD